MSSEFEEADHTHPAQSKASSTVSVRLATPDDAADLARLSQELLAFYGLPRPNQKSYMAHKIKNAVFSDSPGVKVLVAEAKGDVIGFLAYGEMFALANCQNSYFIQDIFISRRHRADGAGKALMIALAKEADANDVQQIDWTADPWNDQAKRFYEKFGPVLKGEKIFYRLLGTHIGNLLKKFT